MRHEASEGILGAHLGVPLLHHHHPPATPGPAAQSGLSTPLVRQGSTTDALLPFLVVLVAGGMLSVGVRSANRRAMFAWSADRDVRTRSTSSSGPKAAAAAAASSSTSTSTAAAGGGGAGAQAAQADKGWLQVRDRSLDWRSGAAWVHRGRMRPQHHNTTHDVVLGGCGGCKCGCGCGCGGDA